MYKGELEELQNTQNSAELLENILLSPYILLTEDVAQ